MYSQIVSKQNFNFAYLDLARRLDKLAKSNKYIGIDGLSFNDINHISSKIIESSRLELIKNKDISPVLYYDIPKKKGGYRRIYVYTISDRIKAQAIYRIIEPEFEKVYSKFLFSYRSSHPSYYAIKSIVRRYKRKFGKDYVLILDLKQYTEYVDREILLSKLRKFKFDSKTFEFLKKFIYVNVFDKDRKLTSTGLVQGVPLIALFANLYLNDLDHYLGPKVQLFRRVGDDLILIDPSKDKLIKLLNYIKKYANEHKLIIKDVKTQLVKNTDDFEYLGYEFKDKQIRIPEKSVRKIISKWKEKFKGYSKSKSYKINKLKKLFYGYGNNFHLEFMMLIKQYNLVDDIKQIQNLTNNFYHLVIKYLYKSYSPRFERLMYKDLKKIRIPKIYEYYMRYHYGKNK